MRHLAPAATSVAEARPATLGAARPPPSRLSGSGGHPPCPPPAGPFAHPTAVAESRQRCRPAAVVLPGPAPIPQQCHRRRRWHPRCSWWLEEKDRIGDRHPPATSGHAMNRPLVAVARLTAIAWLACAAVAARAQGFAPGEETVLSVRYLNVPTGEGRIRVGNPEGDIWPVILQARTSGAASLLDIREHLVSYWDAPRRLSRGSDLQAYEVGDR